MRGWAKKHHSEISYLCRIDIDQRVLRLLYNIEYSKMESLLQVDGKDLTYCLNHSRHKIQCICLSKDCANFLLCFLCIKDHSHADDDLINIHTLHINMDDLKRLMAYAEVESDKLIYHALITCCSLLKKIDERGLFCSLHSEFRYLLNLMLEDVLKRSQPRV